MKHVHLAHIVSVTFVFVWRFPRKEQATPAPVGVLSLLLVQEGAGEEISDVIDVLVPY